MIPQPPPGQGRIDPQGAFPGGNPQGSQEGRGEAKPQAAGVPYMQNSVPGPGSMPGPMPAPVPGSMPGPMHGPMGPMRMGGPQMMMPMPYPYPPPPPPPPRRSGGMGRALFIALLVLMLLGSGLLNLILLAGSLGGSGATVQQTVLEAGSGSDK